MSAFSLWIEPERVDGTVCCLSGDHFPVAYTDHEGGSWKGVGPNRRVKGPVAAVLFESGSIFDLVLDRCGLNPWTKKFPGKPRIRVKCQSKKS